MQAEEQGLKAQESDYFNTTIMGGARDRGVGFSGIPEAERARYGATQYLPALARLKQSGVEQRTGLLEALNQSNLQQRSAAQGIYQGELDRDEQTRQFNESLAAQERQAAASRAAAFNPGGGGGGRATAPGPGMNYSDAKGFQFTNSAGKAITANEYATTSGVPIGKVLHQMGQSGDVRAQRAYDQIAQWRAMGVNPKPDMLRRLFPGIF
jgi:hypothetical protein